MSKDIREDTKGVQDEHGKELDKLWKIITNADPETRKKIIESLDETTTYMLRTRANPYKKPVYKGHKHQILCFNIINLRQKYEQRFAVTSMIGFLYRMLDEFEPAAAKALESQNEPRFAAVFNPKMKAFVRARPEELCREAIAGLTTRIGTFTDGPGEARAQLAGGAMASPNPSENLRNARTVSQLRVDPAGSDATEGVELRNTYHELFVERMKLIKNMLYWYGKDREEAVLKRDLAAKDLTRAGDVMAICKRRVDVIRRKIELRRGWDTSSAGRANTEALLNKAKVFNRPDEHHDFAVEDPKKCMLTDYDKGITMDDFETMLKLRSRDVVLIEEDLAKLEAKVVELGRVADEVVGKVKYYEGERGALRGVYSRQFKIGAEHPLDFEVSEYEPTDEEYDALVAGVKTELGIVKTKEECIDERREQIEEFMNEYFVYNPDTHVQCAYKPNYDDDLRTPLKTAWEEFHRGEMTEAEYTDALEKYQSDVDNYRIIKETEYERSLVPPDDTFFRLQRYIDNNYEELRQATDDIYCEKSDIEMSIVPLKTFEGPEDEVKAEAAEWQRKYADEFEGDVFQATFGIHNLLGPWIVNRERREFYTKNTEVIRRIIQQNEDDQKMGKRLMKERTEKLKTENDAKHGKGNKKTLESYIKERHGGVGGLESAGAQSMDKIDKGVSAIPKKMRRDKARTTDSDKIGDKLDTINDKVESTAEEVEIGWHKIKPQARRGKRRHMGTTETGRFNVEADTQGKVKGYMMKPGDMHKHISVSEMKEFIDSAADDE